MDEVSFGRMLCWVTVGHPQEEGREIPAGMLGMHFFLFLPTTTTPPPPHSEDNFILD